MAARNVKFSILAASIAIVLPVSAQEAPEPEATDAATVAEEAPLAMQSESTSASQSVTSLDQIVVTAQRRRQSLQSVPIAVTTMTAEQLVDSGFRDIGSLEATVPGLTFSRSGGTLSPFLRGVGTNNTVFNAEPSVATYVDGVYLASNISNLFSFNNIERIEVLKGPQGTLFGRNATGGVIQVVTKDPLHEPEAEFKIGYGNFQTTTASAYMTGGLSENLAADFAVFQRNQGEGFGRNLNTGDDIHKGREFAFRSKWLYTPTEKTEARLSLDYSTYDYTGENQQLAPGAIGRDGESTYPGPYNSTLTSNDDLSREAFGAALNVSHDFESLKLVSISSYSKLRTYALQDTDLLPMHGTIADTSAYVESMSQEVQLFASPTSRLDWVVGAYLFDADYVYDPINLSGSDYAPMSYLDIYSKQNTSSYSLYGQATYPIVDKLNATAGVRYTWEEVSISGGRMESDLFTQVYDPQKVKVETPTWRLGVDYEFADNAMGYVTYNRGTKSGGFNLLSPAAPAYHPEELDAYEIGLKSTLFDNRLRLNVAAFYYDYSDIQINILNGPTIDVLNAGAAKSRGVDVDFQLAMSANFTISGGLGFLDTEYTHYPNAVFYENEAGPPVPIDATGHDLVNAPKFTGSLMANYRIPTNIGDIVLNGAVVRNDGFYVGASNYAKQPGYTNVNASIAWNSLDERFGVQLWANNLTDTYQLRYLLESGAGLKQVEAAPRMYGVTLTARF